MSDPAFWASFNRFDQFFSSNADFAPTDGQTAGTADVMPGSLSEGLGGWGAMIAQREGADVSGGGQRAGGVDPAHEMYHAAGPGPNVSSGGHAHGHAPPLGHGLGVPPPLDPSPHAGGRLPAKAAGFEGHNGARGLSQPQQMLLNWMQQQQQQQQRQQQEQQQQQQQQQQEQQQAGTNRGLLPHPAGGMLQLPPHLSQAQALSVLQQQLLVQQQLVTQGGIHGHAQSMAGGGKSQGSVPTMAPDGFTTLPLALQQQMLPQGPRPPPGPAPGVANGRGLMPPAGVPPHALAPGTAERTNTPPPKSPPPSGRNTGQGRGGSRTPAGTLSRNWSSPALSSALESLGGGGVSPDPSSQEGRGDFPNGEVPSRTLFVRNIKSSVENDELQTLFEQYGKIKSMYTACKHRGFVMVSYYDIRAATSAMCQLQGRVVRRRKLDIHYSIPKDAPSEKEINQGTLIVKNIPEGTDVAELRAIFGLFGEVQDVAEPHSQPHVKVEYYDTRHAEIAFQGLNQHVLRGSSLKAEYFRLPVSRRALAHAPGTPGSGSITPASRADVIGANHSMLGPGALAAVQQLLALQVRQGDAGVVAGDAKNIVSSSAGDALASDAASFAKEEALMALFGGGEDDIAVLERVLGRLKQQRCAGSTDRNASTSLREEDVGISRFGREQLSSVQEEPGEDAHKGLAAATKSVATVVNAENSPPQLIGGRVLPPMAPLGGLATFALTAQEEDPVPVSPSNPRLVTHRVEHGAPEVCERRQNGALPLPLDRGLGVRAGKPSIDLAVSLGNMAPPPQAEPPSTTQGRPSASAARNSASLNAATGKAQRRQDDADRKQKQDRKFSLSIDRVRGGGDKRTTLMIKNIPNKYTQTMLLETLDEVVKGRYDFLYLPIDFKNGCNVGYAFINMLSAADIVAVYETFDDSKWAHFNSEKICQISYARIQGKEALITHFQNSMLLVQEDKSFRPVLFNSATGEPEEFPVPTRSARCSRSSVDWKRRSVGNFALAGAIRGSNESTISDRDKSGARTGRISADTSVHPSISRAYMSNLFAPEKMPVAKGGAAALPASRKKPVQKPAGPTI